MSGCGDSDKVNCDEALAEIYLLLDKECSPDHEAELRRHLERCPPCLEQYGIDEQIKQLLARKCGGEHAPEDLRRRLRATIRKTVEQRRDLTVERTEISIEQRTD
ncbi:mycothiol system anti-sigma-R factor [Amycolatopsis arida]|uniref:Mycothiol system anti-sigma-R factor n=1 Tax=Amycolatopsis arida TaxID=587909 RepID=A0A1I5PHG4_9PSEU|nr:mycothiol system anti-sigma-R factor [Amycolatopsis arida]TDX98503.1 mycothiol system anti-sigma-R factor [Amycolatopsis arida]SFP33489.1 mycothiol system anti-sigma-R factor [Amycolatopsis arida]